MKTYEIMFIIRPTVGEDEVKKIIKDFGKILTDKKAKIISEKDMGQRELAFEINDFKSGFYYLYNVEAENDEAVKEFDRLAAINNDIIRHLITKIES